MLKRHVISLGSKIFNLRITLLAGLVFLEYEQGNSHDHTNDQDDGQGNEEPLPTLQSTVTVLIVGRATMEPCWKCSLPSMDE